MFKRRSIRRLVLGLATLVLFGIVVPALTASPASASGECGSGVVYGFAYIDHCWGGGNVSVVEANTYGWTVNIGVRDGQYDNTGWGTRTNVNIWGLHGKWLGWGSCFSYGSTSCNVWIRNTNTGWYPIYATLDVCTDYLGRGNWWCPGDGSVTVYPPW